MRRGLLAVVAMLLVLVSAPAARADVTIGSPLTATPTFLSCGQPCTSSMTAHPDREVASPFSGVITRWRVRTGAGAGLASVRLRVIRRPSGTGDQPGIGISSSPAVVPPPSLTSVFPVRIPIDQGDYIGLGFGPGAVDALALTAGASLETWNNLADGVASNPNILFPGAELLVNADVERDNDGDGYGDETQDNCPTANPGQEDLDDDGAGDECDVDDDGDGADDAADNCDRAANPSQDDADNDGEGDVCDDDRDGDTVANGADVCPDLAAATGNGCPAPPAAPRVNTPPVVRFRAPMSGTAVQVSQAIELEVADDAGEPTVTVFDDDGTICALSGPPYSCTWKPTGADVGRATLLASAVDSDNRSTLGIVRVTVARFPADLTRRVRGRRVRGRLRLPAQVERSLGCRGKVTVRRGKARRTVALKRNCRYAARLPRRGGRVRVRFGGNPVVAPT